MFENRNLRFDLLTLLLLAATVTLGVALATYHPNDPPSSLVYPPLDEVQNSCGPIGAYVAHFLLESIGFGAYYLVASVGVLSLSLLWRRGIDQPVLRALGWAASLLAIATLATMVLPQTSPGPVIGAGGYLGAMGQALLESNFASAGAYILAITVLLAGLLLSTDYLLFKFAATTTMVSGRGLMTLGHLGHAPRLRRKSRPASDLEEVDQFEDEEDEEELEDEEYEYEEDEEEDEQPEDDEAEWEEDDEEEADEEEDEAEAAELTIRTPADKQPEPSQPAAAGDETPLRNKLASRKPGV